MWAIKLEFVHASKYVNAWVRKPDSMITLNKFMWKQDKGDGKAADAIGHWKAEVVLLWVRALIKLWEPSEEPWLDGCARQSLSAEGCGGGEQRGFDEVEHNDVTESFSYADGWQALMVGWCGERERGGRE